MLGARRRVLAAGSTIALAALATWVALAGQAAAHQFARVDRRAPNATVEESPSIGYPGTFFHVHFIAPDRTGTVGGQVRYYVITATGPSSGGTCTSQISQTADSPRVGARVRARMKPGPDGWCLGTFNGTVTEQARPVCPPHMPCPDYIILVRRIGRFSFTVQAQPPGGDTTPPVFAGLQTAVTCTPGPIRPGEMTPYHLSWHAAHDDVTPSSQLEYDIFMSTKPGGENFSQPSWTSAPGATKFQTPDLPVQSAYYFVVRARDQAGNEDSNDVERQGVSPCV
jgi:hypothetical protein